MKNFGMDLKRALDANGRLPSELAKAAGVTGNAVARWLKCIPFQRVKNPLANPSSCEGFFCLLPSGYRRVHAVLLEIQTTGTPNEAAPAAPCPGLFPSCTGSKPTSRGRVGRPSLAIRPCTVSCSFAWSYTAFTYDKWWGTKVESRVPPQRSHFPPLRINKSAFILVHSSLFQYACISSVVKLSLSLMCSPKKKRATRLKGDAGV